MTSRPFLYSATLLIGSLLSSLYGNDDIALKKETLPTKGEVFLISNFRPSVSVERFQELLIPFQKKLTYKDFSSLPKKAFKPKYASYKPSVSFPFHFKQRPERLIFWNLPISDRHVFKFNSFQKKDLVLFLWEPPTVLEEMYNKRLHKRFGRIYTWNDDLVDNVHYFKFYAPDLRPMTESVVPFKEKKLSTMVISDKRSSHPQELYSKRKEIIDFFEKKQGNDFTFFGFGWKPVYKNYKGSGGDKVDLIKPFRFNFCLENMGGVKGYITEKIFDSFAAGVVPIYLGASNVTSFIPENCFIDLRKFSSYEELYLFLKEMPETTYNSYLENIRVFLNSKEAALFSWENLEKTFCEAATAPALYK